MVPGGLESKTAYRFPTFYPPPATPTATATATAMPQMQATPTSSYLPATAAPGAAGLIPLPLFNRAPVAPAQFPAGMSNPPAPAPAALYTLYPPHTSGQCSCRYCTSATTAPVAALSSHTLGTLPVFSAGLNSSLASGVLKYEKEASPRFTPLTHIAEIVPQPQPVLPTGSAATQPSTLATTVTVPSPQSGLQEAQTPPTSESMTASQPSPSCSSVRSVTPLEQPAFPNTSPCPTLPTSSESASIANGYEHDVCESVIAATVPDQELCAVMYESRRGMKPLYHLPANHLEPLMTTSSAPPMTNGSTSQGNTQLPAHAHQWMWNNMDGAATTQPLYEAELPELPETASDREPTKEVQGPVASAQVCVDHEK